MFAASQLVPYLYGCVAGGALGIGKFCGLSDKERVEILTTEPSTKMRTIRIFLFRDFLIPTLVETVLAEKILTNLYGYNLRNAHITAAIALAFSINFFNFTSKKFNSSISLLCTHLTRSYLFYNYGFTVTALSNITSSLIAAKIVTIYRNRFADSYTKERNRRIRQAQDEVINEYHTALQQHDQRMRTQAAAEQRKRKIDRAIENERKYK